MNISFATCERQRALGFIQTVYPRHIITDDTCKEILDLVEQDILRVEDPMMYGNQIRVLCGTNWNDEDHRVLAIESQKCFLSRLQLKPKEEEST